jgi:hypothetical protein
MKVSFKYFTDRDLIQPHGQCTIKIGAGDPTLRLKIMLVQKLLLKTFPTRLALVACQLRNRGATVLTFVASKNNGTLGSSSNRKKLHDVLCWNSSRYHTNKSDTCILIKK